MVERRGGVASAARLAPVLAACFAAAAPAQSTVPAQAVAEPRPWRLQDAVGTPPWLRFGGEQRTRYETLDHQFRYLAPGETPPRRGYADHEDVLALRTLLRAEATGESAVGAVELIDSRQYGTADDGFLDTSMVDTCDLLQAYGEFELPSLGTGTHRLRLGRTTMEIGSRRLVGRNQFRNTVNSFHAVDWQWRTERASLRTFWSLPTRRRPANVDPGTSPATQAAAQDRLRDNDQAFDDCTWKLQFWGLAYERELAARTGFEVYVFGLHERGLTTRRRDLLTPGLRFARARAVGTCHGEVEVVGQFGHSKPAAGAAVPRLDHRALFATAAFGGTLALPGNPACTASYTFASGDRDPGDDDDERFDSLFGLRGEYGPTGLYGAVGRANLGSPELRLQVQPSAAVDVAVAVRGVWLAAARDAWTTSGLRDTTGRAGTHVGTQYELRVRIEVLPRSVLVEAGVAYLAGGAFVQRASDGQWADTSYGYVQCTWLF